MGKYITQTAVHSAGCVCDLNVCMCHCEFNTNNIICDMCAIALRNRALAQWFLHVTQSMVVLLNFALYKINWMKWRNLSARKIIIFERQLLVTMWESATFYVEWRRQPRTKHKSNHHHCDGMNTAHWTWSDPHKHMPPTLDRSFFVEVCSGIDIQMSSPPKIVPFLILQFTMVEKIQIQHIDFFRVIYPISNFWFNKITEDGHKLVCG